MFGMNRASLGSVRADVGGRAGTGSEGVGSWMRQRRPSRADGGPPRLVSAPSPDRVTARCRHFGVCGGCAAQHMGERLYAEWKRDIVVAALRQRGLEPDVVPLRRVVPGTRRRTCRCDSRC